MQPTTNASGGMPSSPRTRARPCSVYRMSSVRSTLGTTTTLPGSTPTSVTERLVPSETAITSGTSRAAAR